MEQARILLMVCLWALVNAAVLVAVAVTANRTPCTKVYVRTFIIDHASFTHK